MTIKSGNRNRRRAHTLYAAPNLLKYLEVDWLMSQLEKAVSDYIKDNGALKEKAEEGGVSLGFRSNYIVANIDEIFASEIVNATETGELHCENCDAYYNYNEAVISAAGELTLP